ncbi:MAG: GGDEF domain-containing protein [Alphaproteobacteria bacterium]|nr:GGDEF domain-containing protein [Alphaproteobacteria bacterium]
MITEDSARAATLLPSPHATDPVRRAGSGTGAGLAPRRMDLDIITPVLNHSAFVREANRRYLAARRHGLRLVALYLDIDGFGAINRCLGRAAGDAVLRHLGLTLERLTSRRDIVGRVGADQFCAVLSHSAPALAEWLGHSVAGILAAVPPCHLGTVGPVHLTWQAISSSEGSAEALLRRGADGVKAERARRAP